MIILSSKAKRSFGAQCYRPTFTSTPKGTYAILCLFTLLWISAFVALLADWPKDSNRNDIRKIRRKYEFVDGIHTAALDGITAGCLTMDAAFLYVPSPFV